MATHFLRVTSGNAAGGEIPIEGSLLIGRAAQGAGELAGDPELSREHARVTYGTSGELLVEDLGSTNGTYVNGHRITAPTPVRGGDTLRIGQTTLTVTGGDGGAQVTAAAVPVPGPQVTQARPVPTPPAAAAPAQPPAAAAPPPAQPPAPAPPAAAPSPAGAGPGPQATTQMQRPPLPPQRGLSSGVLRLAKQPEAFLPMAEDDPPGRHPTIIAIASVITGVLIGGMIGAAIFAG